VAERGIPGELRAGDRVQLEQPAQERPGVVTREVAALDERDRVREVGQRQAARKPWAVRALGGVCRDHELPGGVAAQPPTAPQLLHPSTTLKDWAPGNAPSSALCGGPSRRPPPVAAGNDDCVAAGECGLCMSTPMPRP